eukprot:g15702.t1
MLDSVWAILKEKTGNLVALENDEAGAWGLSDWFVSRWRGIWIDTEALLVGRGLDAIESGWPRAGYFSENRLVHTPFPDHLVKLVSGAQVLVKPATASLHWNWDADPDEGREVLRSESVSQQADVLSERLRDPGRMCFT